jgi:hypothetical protein
MLLVSDEGHIQAKPTAFYAQLVPTVRQLARQAAQDRHSQETRPQDSRSPVFRGHGSQNQQMAEREGFEPSNEVSPVTRFPVAPVQPLRHLSGCMCAELSSTAVHGRLRHRRPSRC